ncbi:MAG: ThuA domain-containing protein [Planctomycetota bacterium]|jgi:type 1 glutamine amidotransferase
MMLSTSSGNGVKLFNAGCINRRRFLAAIAAVLAVSCFVLLLCNLQDTAAAADPAATATAKGKQTANVLIITGIDHPAHNWRQTAPVLAEMLGKDTRLKVRVAEDPHFLDSSALRRYDVVVLHFMNWQQPAPGPKARANLQKCIKDGKGLFVVHFGCGAFQDWPEFRNLAGRVWDPKLRAHDPGGPFLVNITDVPHPITKGLKSFETEDELYTCLTGDRPVNMLATARSKVDKKIYPMAFTFNYGKGRVFHSALGHDVKAISNPGAAELFRRGCAWAAGLTPVQKTKKKTTGSK